MNRTLASALLASVTGLVAAGCATNQPSTTQCCCAMAVPAGTHAAVDEKTADALRAALLDERRTQAFYTDVMAKHGQVRPFSNIVHAEERHEQLVTTLMNRHGVPVTSDRPTNVPGVPDTLAECNRVAAQLERENIAMYDRLLLDVKEADIRAGFENLRAASNNNHLPAFERWSGTATTRGAGRGLGYGAGRGLGYGAGRGPGPNAGGNVAGAMCYGGGPCFATR